MAKLNEVQRGWINYFRVQVFRASSDIWTTVLGTGYAIAFGQTGRSPIGKGKT
nr:group II intron maturase-specific domain-containing protein [Arenibacter sp. NBRC 103722]